MVIFFKEYSKMIIFIMVSTKPKIVISNMKDFLINDLKNMEKASSLLLVLLNIKEILKTINLMAKEYLKT